MADIDIGTLRAQLTLQDSLSPGLEKAAASAGPVGVAFAAITGAAAAAVGAIVGATAAIVSLGQRGAEVNDVQDAFRDLTARAGETADVMLGKLQEGTAGAISNFDLMKMSTGLLATGLVKTSDDMGTLAAGAKLLADRTGGDTAEAFQTLTKAMETGRAGGLKQLGVFADTDVAVQEYAKSLHKSVGALSDHEKATAASQAIVSALKKELEAAGPAELDFGDQVARAKTALSNMTDAVASAIASSPGLVAAVGMIADGLRAMAEWVIKNQQEIRVLISSGLVQLSGALSSSLVAIGAMNEGFRLLRVGLINISGSLVNMAFGLEFLKDAAKDPLNVAAAFQVMQDKIGANTAATVALTDSANDQAATFAGLINKVGMANASFAALAANTEKVSTKTRTTSGDFGHLAMALGTAKSQWEAMNEVATKFSEDVVQKTATDTLAMAELYRSLQDQITIGNKTGLDQQLADLDIKQTNEIARITALYGVKYPEMTAALVTMTKDAYGQMTTAAVDAAAAQEAAAVHAGDTEIDVARRVLANAQAHEAAVLANAESTDAAIAAAHQASVDAQEAVDKIRTKNAVDRFTDIAAAASTILRSLFGKSKGAAIAAAIIDTIAAGVKVLAQLGWWGIPAAAAIVAQGYAQVQKIRSTNMSEGFATGTPGTSFVDFGRGSVEMLHGQEAVVNRAQGESLASMIGDEIRTARAGAGDGQSGGPMGGDVYLDGLKVGMWLQRSGRAGLLGAPA